jgi:hypothetical protein
MHEYLAPLKERHAECKWCGKRSPHICMRCGYCYSCHPISEQVEKRRVLPTSA